MSISEVFNMLKTTNLPVCYKAWPTGAAPSLPYICFFFIRDDNFAADGKVYHKNIRLSIELYTEIKDEESEGKIEQVLSDFFYTKEENYIDSEKCYQISYELEV